MRRREFLGLLGGAAASPVPAWAQRPAARARRIGILTPFAANDPEWGKGFASFLARLRESGWIVDRNLQIDARFAAGDAERMSAHARELVGQAPDAILVVSNPGLAALEQSTESVPIVFVHVADPVGSGLVASLARPGGNATGFTNFEPSMGSKWLEILREVAPGLKRAMVLLHAQTAANVAMSREAQAAGPSLDIAVTTAAVQNAADIEQAVTQFGREPNGGLIVMPHVVTAGHRALIAELGIRQRLPAVAAFKFMTVSGCLMSYGIDSAADFRRAAGYIDRIFNGERPADLPVQQPTKFELVINLKTAKALGLTIPESFLLRADEVIE